MVRRHPHVVHIDELTWEDAPRPDGFKAQRKSLTGTVGAQQIGASLYLVQPGQKAFPFHGHEANEEAIFILSGRGTLRLGDDKVAVSQGDYIALPAGPANAHQLIAGLQPLVYLCVSTMKHPDVLHYPDSGKIGVMAGSAPGGNPKERTLTQFFRSRAEVAYWDGETRSNALGLRLDAGVGEEEEEG